MNTLNLLIITAKLLLETSVQKIINKKLGY